jgi:hypothetical protein
MIGKDEFKGMVKALFDEACPDRGSGNRTCTEAARNVVAEQLYELCVTQVALTEDDLTRALLRTTGKYTSLQEQAQAIKRLLTT